MKEQETKAQSHISPNNWCETYLKPQDVKTEYQYEIARREQFMRDVGITEYNIGSTAIVTDQCDDEDDYWEPSTERQYCRETVAD